MMDVCIKPAPKQDRANGVVRYINEVTLSARIRKTLGLENKEIDPAKRRILLINQKGARGTIHKRTRG